MLRQQSLVRSFRGQRQARWGGIAVLSAVAMVMVIGFTALAVDVGFMAQTKSQMQGAADGAALAAGLELPNGWGTGKTLSADQVRYLSGSAAQTVATTYRLGEQASAYLDTTRDVRFGQRTKSVNGDWVQTWDASPYNIVEVTIRRDQPVSGQDGHSRRSAIAAVLRPGVERGPSDRRPDHESDRRAVTGERLFHSAGKRAALSAAADHDG